MVISEENYSIRFVFPVLSSEGTIKCKKNKEKAKETVVGDLEPSAAVSGSVCVWFSALPCATAMLALGCRASIFCLYQMDMSVFH
jgi:hypothetical protein